MMKRLIIDDLLHWARAYKARVQSGDPSSTDTLPLISALPAPCTYLDTNPAYDPQSVSRMIFILIRVKAA